MLDFHKELQYTSVLQEVIPKRLKFRICISLLTFSGSSPLFSVIAMFLYPPTNVLKVLRSLGKSRGSQTSSLISEEKIHKNLSSPLGENCLYSIICPLR